MDRKQYSNRRWGGVGLSILLLVLCSPAVADDGVSRGFTSADSPAIFRDLTGTLSVSNGPAAGGNVLTITCTALGNGSDITNVTICGVVAAIQSQTADSVTVVVGSGGEGTGDIKVYSASQGVTTFANSYTYNLPGYISGSLVGWATMSGLPAARAGVAAARANGKIYAIGGSDGVSFKSTVYVYDPLQPTQGWRSVSNLPAVRAWSAAASVNGKLYLIGGSDGSSYQSTVFSYDPLQPAQGWRSVSNLPAARAYLAAASASGKLYAIGGSDGTEAQYTVYAYDPLQPAQGWLSVSNLPASRRYLAAASVNGKIYAIGGYGIIYNHVESTVYEYDPLQPTQGWLSVGDLPGVRAQLAAASVNGKIYAIAGWSGVTYWSTVFEYDPLQPAQGWVNVSGLPASCGDLAAVGGNDRLYAIGGYGIGYLSSVYEGSLPSRVLPSSGPLAGGNAVTIHGGNLGYGDVTNVTLCGIPATVLLDDSPTQIVVAAGLSTVPTTGDVVVCSISCGVTIGSRGYTYALPAPNALPATNTTVSSFFANWDSVAGATDYLLDVSTTSNFTTFVVGYSNLSIGVVTTYRVSGLNPSTAYFYRLRYQQDGLLSLDSATVTEETLGGGPSMSSGPSAGGNTLTITGVGLGNGSDITNVTVCGVVAAIQTQTSDSVTVVVGPGGEGTGDIRIYSVSRGVTTFANSYIYNPTGSIAGPFIGWTSVSNLPAARSGLAAASVNGRVYAIGGSDGSHQSSVYEYDPMWPTQGWRSVSNLPAARANLAAEGANGRLYAIAGDNSSYAYQPTVYMYNPDDPAQGWLNAASLPKALYCLAEARANGKIYTIGGYGVGGYQSTVYEYDPSLPAQGWLAVSNLPAVRANLAGASVNGKLYAIGGDPSPYKYQSTVYAYDPLQSLQGWRSVSNLPAPRSYLAAASVNGRLYAMGGYNSNGFQSTVYEYDPLQPVKGWRSVSNLPAARRSLAAASAAGKLYAIGGNDSNGVQSTVYEGNFAPGVVPSSGVLAGGNTVTISGSNLGNGDITNVTLCGISATIFADQSPTQVVVIAGAGTGGTNGHVAVYSASYGVAVSSNSYTYAPSAPIALPPTNMTLNSFFANWSSVAGATNYLLDVSATSGFTSFVEGYSNRPIGVATTYPVIGLNAESTYYYRLRCQQNGLTSLYSETVSGATEGGGISVSNGPSAGGNLLTIIGTALGSGSDITNVTICGVVAAIQSQTADSVTVVVGPGGAGTGDIRVYSASQGVAIFTNAYTYNPPGWITDTLSGWSRVSSLPAVRSRLAATSVDGRLYAIGGYDGSYQSTVYENDLRQPGRGWQSVSNLPAVRGYLAAASVNGKLYAIGGYDGSAYQATVHMYDPLQPAQGWQSVSNLPAACSRLAAASVCGRLYAIGGYDGSYQSAVYEYDPSQPAQGWQSVSNLPAARADLAAASVHGRLYAIGGYDGSAHQSTVFAYDPLQPAQGWQSVSNLPAARSRLAAASVWGKLYAIAGINGGSFYSTVFEYDPLRPARGWQSVSGLPAAWADLAGADVNGRLYAVGGWRGSHQSTVFEGGFSSGVSPTRGPLAGGNAVNITGGNLGRGDVTSVTLCGISAAILEDNSPTQIVVLASAGTAPTNGDVVVSSTSYGVTVASNGYSYLPPTPEPLSATNIAVGGFFANWNNVAGATDYLLDVSAMSNFTTFVANYVNLSVGDVTTYRVSGLNAGAVYYYRLRSQQNGVVSESSSVVAVQTSSGSLSVSNGAAGGGNPLTITGTGLGNGFDITNVTVCGVVAAIQSQTADSVTVVVGSGDEGVGDIKVYSASLGETTFVDAYTFNPPGWILGPLVGWLSVSNLPAERRYLGAASVNGKVYAIGGESWTFHGYQSTVFEYDPANPTQGWLSISNMPVGRSGLAAASVNGRIYAIAGHDNTSRATVFEWDSSQPTQGWLCASSLPKVRVDLAAASANGKLYAIGGAGEPLVYEGSYASGVSPSSGPLAGGTTVTISGGNLGNGDVTNVTLCGVSATILSDRSPTQVVVVASAGMVWSNGDVEVRSVRYGTTVASNGYTYAPPAPTTLAASDATLNSFFGNWNSVDGVTNYLLDVSTTSNFVSYVAGYSNLSVGNVTTHRISGLNAATRYYYRLRSEFNGAASLNSDTGYGETWGGSISPSNGPIGGGNTLTITGSGLGNGSDITNVTICGVTAAIQSQTADSVTVVVGPDGDGTGDIRVDSVSRGVTTFSYAYTYNPPGCISGPFRRFRVSLGKIAWAA